MAHPRPRYDGYGRPLPTLVDARQEDLFNSETNQARRRELHALLDAKLRLLCVRGTWGEVQIRIKGQDGTLQAGAKSGLLETHGRTRRRNVEDAR